jgi:hypothetical protein
MQTILPQPPEVGKTYISKTDPTFSIYVRRIDLIEADGDDPAGFCVEVCAPKDKGITGAMVIELFDDEWRDFDPSSESVQTA